MSSSFTKFHPLIEPIHRVETSGEFSFITSINSHEAKVIISNTKITIIHYPKVSNLTRREYFTIDEIFKNYDCPNSYHIGTYDLILNGNPEDHNKLEELIKIKNEKENGQKMCRAFLKEVCQMTDEQIDEKRLFYSDNFRFYTASDKGFTYDCPTVEDTCIEDSKKPKRTVSQQEIKPKFYEPPVGWYSMALYYPDVGERAIDEHWCFCYHGTQARFVSSIIKNRLVVPGNRTEDGKYVKIQPGHIPNKNYIYTSPSIYYSSHYIYAWPTTWQYTNDFGETKTFYVRTVFQVRQKPGTFSIQRNTVGDSCWDGSVLFDENFGNEELEWESSDQNTIVPKALLIHFSEKPVEKLFDELEMKRRDACKFAKSFADVVSGFKKNLLADKKKILWVDDKPSNNLLFTDYIKEHGVIVDICIDTDSALNHLRMEPHAYYCAITDMVRKEKRKGDAEPLDYYEAGIDFIIEAKKIIPNLPIYMYSSYCRSLEASRTDLVHRTLDAGADKICTTDDVDQIIRGVAV